MVGPVPGEGERGAVLPGGQNRPSEQDDRRQMQAEAGRAAPIRGGRPPESEKKDGHAGQGQEEKDVHGAGRLVANEVGAGSPCEGAETGDSG